MNRVTIIGRLAADPEIKQTTSGLSVCNFTIAVDRKGTKGEERITDWIDVVTWRHTAEFVSKYFQKGSPVVIEGSIQTRMWEDKDGKKRKAVEVVADNVEFVPKAKGEAEGNKSGDFEEVVTEDLPF
ncbi:MAG: single-stranded DNA-binding protein [Clostridia bacterium]|nr:single-stranded DNA-binding protein [Clostridia bacterium]